VGRHLAIIDYFSYMDAGRFNHSHYNKHLQPHANKLRKQMTKAEACLWTWEEAAIKDEKRELALRNAGFVILRFSDKEILTNINQVRMAIEGWIEMQNTKSPH